MGFPWRGRFAIIAAKGGALEAKKTVQSAVEAARRAVEIAAEKQAEDIVLFDLRGLCSFTDYFVICSGSSDRQRKTIAEEIDVALDKSGVPLYHREGTEESGWVLLDFGDVLVHIFSPEQRQFYQLEHLWSQATALVRVQ